MQEDIVTKNDFAKEEADRFSLVVNATYVQWDAPMTNFILRSGRLVDEPKSPFVLPKLIIPKDKKIELDFSWLGKIPQAEICILNKTKGTNPLPPYLAIFKDDDKKPFGLVRPTRMTWIQPTARFSVQAFNEDATITIYAFPE